jgi:hypothetical protein
VKFVEYLLADARGHRADARHLGGQRLDLRLRQVLEDAADRVLAERQRDDRRLLQPGQVDLMDDRN